MKNGLISTTTERCVKLKIILLGSAEVRVNESVLIPEGTLVDAAANTAVINRLTAVCETGKGNLTTSGYNAEMSE